MRAIDTRRAVWVWKLFGALLFSGVPEKEREKGEREVEEEVRVVARTGECLINANLVKHFVTRVPNKSAETVRG